MKERKIMIVLLLILILVVGGILIFDYDKGARKIKQNVIENPMMTVVPTQIPIAPTPNITPSPEPTASPQPTILPQYEEYLKINQDVVGKIEIPDTIISYPVLWDGREDYYYLHHDINKRESVNGSICVEYSNSNAREEFIKNTIIFGHNMKDKSMFHEVNGYKEKDFFVKHPLIYYDNLYEKATWRVFSVYILNADKEGILTRFSSDQEYMDFLEQVKERSMYKVDVPLKVTDEIITICTCSYEYPNGRTIVHAVRVDE